jgi:hypothetical protein
MKALLDQLENQHPDLRQTMLAALGNVNLSHLLARRAAPPAERKDAATSEGAGNGPAGGHPPE